ncbi:MAG: MFS transporter [Leptospirales bacterium]|nr:MFS transporter [Leptospirales bacterium]
MDNEKSIKRTAIIIAIASGLILPFMGSSVNIVLPAIGKEFGLNTVQMGWVLMAFLLTSAAFLLPLGRLSDIAGRKKMFIIGITSYSIVTSLIALLPGSVIVLITLRALQGLTASMIFVTGMTILISIFPPSERGKILGINTACIYLGLSLGPSLGGALAYYFSWRSVFIVTAVLGFFLTLYVPLKLKGEWADAKGESFDIKGSIIYILSFSIMFIGFSTIPKTSGFILAPIGVIALIIFVVYENKTSFPILRADIFKRNRAFTMAAASALINYSATFGVAFLMSLYLQNVKGFTAFHAGQIMLIQPVVQTICSLFSGRLSDKKDPQSIASAGMAITALGLIMLIFVQEDTSLPYIMATLSVLGTGFGIFSSPNTTAAMNAAEKQYFGVASSLLSTMRLMGQIISMSIAMVVFTLIAKGAVITTENSGLFLQSMKVILIIFAFLCFIGVFLKTRKRQYLESLSEL